MHFEMFYVFILSLTLQSNYITQVVRVAVVRQVPLVPLAPGDRLDHKE